MPDKALIRQLQSQIDSYSESTSARHLQSGKTQKQGDPKDASGSAQGAFKKIVALVNARDRSEKSIRDRLGDCEFDDREIDEAVSRAKEYGLIDDARFAEVLVRSRISQGKGRAGIERELRENEIDPYTIPDWPYAFDIDENTEYARALETLNRKPPRSKNLREGAYRKLISKGYSSSIAASAARAWCEMRLE